MIYEKLILTEQIQQLLSGNRSIELDPLWTKQIFQRRK